MSSALAVLDSSIYTHDLHVFITRSKTRCNGVGGLRLIEQCRHMNNKIDDDSLLLSLV